MIFKIHQELRWTKSTKEKNKQEKKNTPSKTQPSFIPNPQEEAAMASTFLQSSLLVTISESDTTSRGVILVKNHLTGKDNSSTLILIANKFPIKLQDKVL